MSNKQNHKRRVEIIKLPDMSRNWAHWSPAHWMPLEAELEKLSK